MLQFNATFIVAIVSFILFIIVMDKILYKPISKIVNEREEFINSNYKEAQSSSEEMQKIQYADEERILKSKTESKKIISTKIEQAQTEGKQQTEVASIQCKTNVNKAKEEIKLEESEIQQELQSHVKDLAESISEKLLGLNTSIENPQIINKV